MQRWIAAGLLTTLLAVPVHAQNAADFYRGKTVTLIVGYSAGLTRRRDLLSAIVLIIALGAVLALVIDLDQPRQGFVQVSQQPIIDLQEQIGPPS